MVGATALTGRVLSSNVECRGSIVVLSEFELKKIEKSVGGLVSKRRPPVPMRKKLDLGYRISGHSVEIFSIRPVWNNPEEYREHDVAKATYVKTQKVWKLYWQRQDLRWHSYEPKARCRTIEEVVAEVDADPFGCFWG